MTDHDATTNSLAGRLQQRLTRRTLARTGATLAAAGLAAKVAVLRSAAQSNPDIHAIINHAITFEGLAVTIFGAARKRGDAIGFSDDVTRYVRAAQCEEEAHYHFFEAAGASPSTSDYTIDDAVIESQSSFLNAMLDLESIQLGAYMAAARAFATLSNLKLVELCYQIGAVEAQHLAMTKLYEGARLPSDRAFAKWMFTDISEATVAIAKLGYISGKGTRVAYPGPVDRYCRGITGLVPETTEDQPGALPGPGASPTIVRG